MYLNRLSWFYFFFSHFNLGACAGFALANCDWLGRTIAFHQVFFQQGRVALGKWCIGSQKGKPKTPGMDFFCTVPKPHFLGRMLIWPGYFGEHVLGLLGLYPSSLWKSVGFVSLSGKASLVSISAAILLLRSWHVYFPLEFQFRGKTCVEIEHGGEDGISCKSIPFKYFTTLTVPFGINLNNISFEISKKWPTKPHEDSVTLLSIKLEIRGKNSMKKDRHFTLLVFSKILCVVCIILNIFITCAIIIFFLAFWLLLLIAAGLVFFIFLDCVLCRRFIGGNNFFWLLPVKTKPGTSLFNYQTKIAETVFPLIRNYDSGTLKRAKRSTMGNNVAAIQNNDAPMLQKIVVPNRPV